MASALQYLDDVLSPDVRSLLAEQMAGRLDEQQKLLGQVTGGQFKHTQHPGSELYRRARETGLSRAEAWGAALNPNGPSAKRLVERATLAPHSTQSVQAAESPLIAKDVQLQHPLSIYLPQFELGRPPR